MIEALSLQPLPPEDEALRPEVRAFLRETRGRHAARAPRPLVDGLRSRLQPQAGRARLDRPDLARRSMAAAGRGAFARFVLVEELLAAGAPVSAHWIADRQSGPLILRFGTEAQRRFYLPRICRAEAFFCIGMSEPNTGSDLASVAHPRGARAATAGG